MARRIRWLGVGMVLCFFLLFLQLNNIQVVKAHQYANDPDNPAVEAESQQTRGVIQSADGVVLARSVNAPKHSGYKYERVYNPQWASTFSDVVGIDSPRFTNYGVEAYYNSYLVAHNKPITSLKDLLTTGGPVTDTITLTISTKMQAAAQAALGGKTGAIVALDPQTGAVLAMYSNPTYDPNPLVSLNPTTESNAFNADTHINLTGFVPFTSMAYQDSFSPRVRPSRSSRRPPSTSTPPIGEHPDPVHRPHPCGLLRGRQTTAVQRRRGPVWRAPSPRCCPIV